MEDKIREIVSVYIKVPAAQIADSTPIDRTALQSSILLHRMFARLGEEGIVINDYAGIKVFGDLIGRQGAGAQAGAAAGQAAQGAAPGIGIDIEEVAALVADLRKEAFYTQNFTPAEIAYCILQADPYSSLTGLFAVKEAIIKADAQFRQRPFHTFGISHSTEGRPELAGFSLSISHAGGMAVAVAVRDASGALPAISEKPDVPSGKPATMAWIAWMALLVAAAALLLALKH
jgi:phosphopantetheine--protein transferase-like protein